MHPGRPSCDLAFTRVTVTIYGWRCPGSLAPEVTQRGDHKDRHCQNKAEAEYDDTDSLVHDPHAPIYDWLRVGGASRPRICSVTST